MLCLTDCKAEPMLTGMSVLQGRAGVDGGRGSPGETGAKVSSNRSQCAALCPEPTDFLLQLIGKAFAGHKLSNILCVCAELSPTITNYLHLQL